MTLIDLPAPVLALASESGADVRSTPDGLDVGDSETSHRVHRVEGEYVVEEGQRGAVTRVVLRTAEEPVVVRFLALVLATAWRSTAGLSPLPSVDLALPDDVSVEKTGPRRFVLRWTKNGVVRRADDLVELRALDLARTLGHPVDDVVASLREPAGAPVFSTT